MGRQPRADVKVGSGGAKLFSCFSLKSEFSKKSEHFECRHVGISPFGRPKKICGDPFSHICAKIYVTLPICHSHPSLSLCH